MELYKDVLYKEAGKLLFDSLLEIQTDLKEIINLKSVESLQKIKAAIENDSLSDFECIEEIVCIFESMGSDGGNRHDFG